MFRFGSLVFLVLAALLLDLVPAPAQRGDISRRRNGASRTSMQKGRYADALAEATEAGGAGTSSLAPSPLPMPKFLSSRAGRSGSLSAIPRRRNSTCARCRSWKKAAGASRIVFAKAWASWHPCTRPRLAMARRRAGTSALWQYLKPRRGRDADVAYALVHLASVHASQGRYGEAEGQFKRATCNP